MQCTSSLAGLATMKHLLLFLLTTVLAVAAEDELTTFTLDGCSIHYNPTSAPTITMYQDGKKVPMWFTPINQRNFITAAKVNDTVFQNGGNFVFPDPTPFSICKEMSISTATGGKNDRGERFAEFKGTLCNELTANFSLRFSSHPPVPFPGSNYPEVQILLSLNQNTFYNQIRLSVGCELDEQFYGFGVQYSMYNMKGHRLPVFLSEQGVGRGLEPITSILDAVSPGAGGTWYTTYTSVPQYMTSYNRFMSLRSRANTVFDMTKNDTITIELVGNLIQGVIRPGDSLLDLITSYTEEVGRLKPLPSWIGQGAVLGLQGGTEAVQKTLQQVESQWGNLSDVVGVWLQDWTGQRVFNGPNDLPRTGLWWNWEVDSTHYPKWTEFVSDLYSKGIRTLTYINPLFSNVSERGTPYKHNFYKEGLENDYFIRNESGEVWRGYGNSCMADLTQIKVVSWIMQMILQNMLGTGVCGWMCDFGESVPLHYKPNLSTALNPDFHSDYPYFWGSLNLNAITQSSNTLCDPDDVVYFMRSGNYISPTASRAFWLGDQLVTWDSFDGLGTAVIGMLTGGLSGFSSTHSDIGGYTAINVPPLKYVRSKELFMRWCELAAFTTIYRTHLGTLPDDNWQFNSDNETLQHFFNMAIVFQSWDFYRQQLMKEAFEKGWPVARHMMLVFPYNPKVFELSEELKYQFMLGTELLVAPVLQPFNPTGLVPFARVFLPAETEWVHVWSGTVYKGANQFVNIGATPGKPCVLHVSGSEVGKQFVQNLKNRGLL